VTAKFAKGFYHSVMLGLTEHLVNLSTHYKW